MNKKIVAFVLTLLFMGQLTIMAQSLQSVSSSYSAATYTFTAPTISLQHQQIEGSDYTSLVMEGAGPSADLGMPNLPVFSQMIEIPVCSDVKVSITINETKEIPALKYRMMPVQPAPSKADRSPRPFVIDNKCYGTNAFYSAPAAAWVETLGIGRDRNLAMLRISPVSYNPVTGALRIANSITVTLTYDHPDAAATRELHSRYYSPDFSVGNSILGSLTSKEIRNAAPLHFLIVAHSSFRGQLDEFVNWKKRQGFLVTVAYTDEPTVGTSNTAIADYIKGYYTNATEELPAPTYLLLVGDHQQIPAFNARCGNPATDHVTDLYFATWTVGDNIPDCYFGRFSARNAAELKPQIDKTLFYESYGFDDDSYLNTGVLIAGQDRGYSGDNAYTYADPAMDYIAKTYINAANGYNTVYYYKNNTSYAPDGVTVSGSSNVTATANILRNYYNQGCGWVNYSAHGYDDEWSTPNFNTVNAAAMTNYGKPSIMIGNCCLSGKFNTTYSDVCLGEALLQKSNNAGAVAYFGGTNSTYWPHDFCWAVGVRSGFANNMNTSYDPNHLGVYDRLFHTHNEVYSAWHTTAGSMNVAGNTAVESYGSYALYYWEIYELFGDPSLMPWLGTADEMAVNATPVIPMGTTEYTIQAVPYAYAAITSGEDHELVCAAYADANGQVVLEIPADAQPGTYELAIWAQNYKPFFQELTLAVLDGPYILITDIQPTATAKPGSMISFDFTLTNIGNAVPTVGLINLVADNEGAVIVQPVAHFHTIQPGDTVTITANCPTYLAKTLENGTAIRFTASADFGGNQPSSRRKNVVISAPKVVASDMRVSPTLSSGVTSTVSIRITNEGSDTTSDLTFTFVNNFDFLAQDADPVHVGMMAPGDSRTIVFYPTMAENLPNTNVPFHLYASDSASQQLIATYNMRCGDSGIEDFETGDFTQFEWNQNNNPWSITNSGAYAGTYCARSKENLGNRSESRMSLNFQAPTDDSISFYYKVSSEEGYDKFVFTIDGIEKVNASGEVDWTRASFPVSAGNHIFKFSYTKDWYTVDGSDCAWVDNISFPFTGTQCDFLVDTVCQGSEYTFAEQTIPTSQIGVTTYSDTASDTWSYLSLNVMPTPEVTIEVVGQEELGQCLLLIAHGATNYVWSTGDSTDCIAVCPQEHDSYSVTGFRGGCSNDASLILLDIDNVAVSPVDIYPNPAHDRVNVHADNLRSITLTNLMGQAVQRQSLRGNDAIINLQNLPNGIYFLRVETADAVTVKKLIRR